MLEENGQYRRIRLFLHSPYRPMQFLGLFPKEQTEKEKALLKNKTILSGLAPNFKRGKAIFERNTLKIVEMDVLSENKHNIMRY